MIYEQLISLKQILFALDIAVNQIKSKIFHKINIGIHKLEKL